MNGKTTTVYLKKYDDGYAAYEGQYSILQENNVFSYASVEVTLQVAYWGFGASIPQKLEVTIQ